MHRLLVMGAALIATLGAGVVSAPAAQATTAPTGTSIVFFPTNAGTCGAAYDTYLGNPGSSIRVVDFCGGSVSVSGPLTRTQTGSGTTPKLFTTYAVTLGAEGSGTVSTAGGSVTVTITSEPLPPPVVHDVIQQVGVPASGSCDDVDPHVGHYDAAPFGGWSKSWAEWINDGKGGEVCTRELEERSDGTIILVG